MRGTRISLLPDLPIIAILATVYGGLLFHYRSIIHTGLSLSKAAAVDQGLSNFNPQFFIYGHATLFIKQLFNLPDGLLAGQVHNLLWAVVGLAALYVLVVLATNSRILAITAALVQVTVYGYWYAATQLYTYVPVAACLTAITAYLAARPYHANMWWHLVIVAPLWFLAICYDWIAVLYLIPLGWLYLKYNGFSKYLALVGGTVVIVLGLGLFDHTSNLERGPSPVRNNWQELINDIGLTFIADIKLKYMSLFVLIAISTVFVLLQIPVFIRGRDQGNIYIIMATWLVMGLGLYFGFQPDSDFLVFFIPAAIILLAVSLSEVAGWLFKHKANLVASFCVLAVAAGLYTTNQKTIYRWSTEHDADYLRAEYSRLINHNQCFMVCSYNTYMNQYYYFDEHNNISIGQLLNGYYRNNDSTYVDSLLRAKDCLLLEAAYLYPEYGYYDKDGFKDPDEWLQFFNAIFKIEWLSNGRFNARSFEVIDAGEVGTPYLEIGRGYYTFESYEQLFRMLDVRLRHAKAKKENVFLNWYYYNRRLVN